MFLFLREIQSLHNKMPWESAQEERRLGRKKKRKRLIHNR
jgi:hypothetical protein